MASARVRGIGKGGPKEQLIAGFFAENPGLSESLSDSWSKSAAAATPSKVAKSRLSSPVLGRGAAVYHELPKGLPFGMQAPPCIEYDPSSDSIGLRVRFFEKAIDHARKDQGKVNPKLEPLEGAGSTRMRKITAPRDKSVPPVEPPGLRFLRCKITFIRGGTSRLSSDGVMSRPAPPRSTPSHAASSMLP